MSQEALDALRALRTRCATVSRDRPLCLALALMYDGYSEEVKYRILRNPLFLYKVERLRCRIVLWDQGQT